LNVDGEMCVVENKEDNEDHEDEQKQGEQQQKQQCEKVMQQQEEDKDIIDEIYDLEYKENIQSEKSIVIEMNDELEVMGVSKCESIYHTRKCRSKMKMIKTLISCGNFNDQCDVLKSFLMDPQLEEH
jgi:hypothetical protein